VQAHRSEHTIAAVQRERGVVLIIAYKLGKAALWLVLAAVIAVMTGMGLGADLLGLAAHLRHHAGAWSLELANLVTRAATRRGLWTIVVALVADGATSLFEGWALWHGHWWGPWIVVVATASILPFEIVYFVHRPHLVRAAVFVLNLAIVAYLARKALRERRARRTSVGAPRQ
jgi:uncharacterized membrane protein (DUF2068 family)